MTSTEVQQQGDFLRNSLREFVVGALSSSVTEHRRVFGELENAISQSEDVIPESAIRGVVKLLVHVSLFRYNQLASHRLTCHLIVCLMKNSPDVTLSSLATNMIQSFKKYPANSISSVNAMCGLQGVKWLALALGSQEATHWSNETFKITVEALSYCCFLASGNPSKIVPPIQKQLKFLFIKKSGLSDRFHRVVLECDPSLQYLCLFAVLAKPVGKEEFCSKFMATTLDVYSKTILGSKTKPPSVVLIACHSFVVYISREQFQQLLLPNLRKAMLRSPELAIRAVGLLISQLDLELSQFALEILKPMAAQLISSDELARMEAQVAVAALVHQCSDETTVEELIEFLFGVLKGSEGKLTTGDQRISVFRAIGSLSNHTISGVSNVEKVGKVAVSHFAQSLKGEANENMIAVILSMLSKWTARFGTCIPSELNFLFKEGLAAKRPTSTIKYSYLKCMLATFHTNVLSFADEFKEKLVSILEDGMKQTTQNLVVTEALCAAVLLLKLHRLEANKGIANTLVNVWNNVIAKELFTREKFVISLDGIGICLLIDFVERVVIDRPCDIPVESYPADFGRSILLGLLWPDYSVRKQISANVKRLMTIEGVKFAKYLMQELFDHMLDGWLNKILEGKDASRVVGDVEQSDDELKGISGKLIADSLLLLSKIDDSTDEEEICNLAKSALLPCCLPIAVSHNDMLWVKFVNKLTSERDGFMEKNANDFCKQINNCSDITVSKNAVRLLMQLQLVEIGGKMSIYCVNWFGRLLTNMPIDILIDIRPEEVAIMQTQEGTLYDSSILDNETYEKERNVKRESRTYSYKDQMADTKLRKEIEEKKLREGNLKPKELTPKQKEMMAVQLKKEVVIRTKLTQLHTLHSRSLKLYGTALAANKVLAKSQMNLVLKHVVPLLQSPLVAQEALNCWTAMEEAAFYQTPEIRYSGMALAYCSARLLNATINWSPEWTQEPLASQARRILKSLWAYVNEDQTIHLENGYGNDDDDVEDDDNGSEEKVYNPLPMVAFAYCYPLLRSILIDCPTLFGKDSKSLAIMSLHLIHAQLSSPFDDVSDLVTLPFDSLASMLIHLVSDSDPGVVQQSAADCALALTQLVSKHWLLAAIDLSHLINTTVNSLLNPINVVREYVLKMLLTMKGCLREYSKSVDGIFVVQRLWVVKFDPSEDCRQLATKLWDEMELDADTDICFLLLEDAINLHEFVRVSSSESIGSLLRTHKDLIQSVLEHLSSVYNEKAQLRAPVLDEMGRVIQEHADQWQARDGVARTLKWICPLLPDDLITKYFEILCPQGVSDRNSIVRALMLQAAVDGVKAHGEFHLNKLLPLFEEMLINIPDEGSYDALRQALVILLGTLAKHLDQNDPKIRPIVARLIETLSTPSQQVQEAVAQCLPPLVPSIREQSKELSANLLSLLLDAENYGERRGAAYGLAGMVKGLGIVSLRELEIMSTLQEAIKEKKNTRHREGALLAIEMLCSIMGKLFEPYVVQILPNLLVCFGDPDQHVRKAADDCAKAVMKQLSAHGVKLVLPALLAALEEDSWRTKSGSVDLLGAMAYCAPKQLSSCLPNIVPKLISVLSDTHARVQKAGEQALKQIGQVIRNPEIQAISQTLLEALEDPAHKTSYCLQKLIKTKFVHYIDAPSLALIIPVLTRAFDDRSTETRRVACQIIANIYALTDQKDVEPYLGQLLPGLKKSLMDPVPDIRGMAARALGTMIGSAKGDVGQRLRGELIPWLKQQLIAENNPVDRSGAAQGLSEVLGALGEDQLTHVMPDIIRTAESESVEPYVRHGYILMYIFLPPVFGEQFKQYLAQVIPSVLKALADESEYVRETALRAGQRLISTYCESAIPLLLPQLERGLFDDNWRIRYSSVQLLGDFLYKISGVTGKMSTEGGEDDVFGTESASRAITQVLGVKTRNRVLSGLYIARSDVAVLVRQASGHVWKVVVANTPRTLKEILPTLFSLLLGCLASSSEEKQQVAARCLGELVKKMGDRILVDVIPVLEDGLKSPEADQRQGVCIALKEIFANTTKEMVMMYVDHLIPTITMAIYDPLPDVRKAAADTFCVFHSTIGPKALDDVLLPLIEQLTCDELAERTLGGLREVMARKSNVVLPYLVPKLTKPPVNTVALSQLASVAGDVLSKHLSKILEALLLAIVEKEGNTTEESDEFELCLKVLLSVPNDDGVATIVDVLLQRAVKGDKQTQIVAAELLSRFCLQTKMDLRNFTDQLIQGCIILYANPESRVAQAATETLACLIKSMDQREHLDCVTIVKHSLQSASSKRPADSSVLKGLSVPKGLQPLIVILREGVLSGSAEQKETSAQVLTELIQLSDTTALKPHVVNITGPLIRVLGDRYPPFVKISILTTLAVLLEKVGVMLKPFLPQLQSTFLKALQDPTSRGVRLNAGKALSRLITIHPKPDTIFADLTKNVQNSDDPAIQETFLVTLRSVVEAVGPKLAAPGVNQAVEILLTLMGSTDDSCRPAVGAALGAIVGLAIEDEAQIEDILNNVLLNSDAAVNWLERHCQCVALQVALKVNCSRIYTLSSDKLMRALHSYVTADRVPVSSSGLRASGFVLVDQLTNKCSSEIDKNLLTTVVRAINHPSNDVKTLAANVVHHLAKAGQGTGFDVAFLKIVVPMMVNGTKEKNSAVRYASEEALTALLGLRKDHNTYTNYLNSLDAGAKESLSDVYNKALCKLTKQAEPIAEDLDDTIRV